MKRLVASLHQFRINVKTLLILIGFLGMVMAFYVQERRSLAQMRAIRLELLQTQLLLGAHERINRLFEGRGLCIFKAADSAEILSVGRGAGYPRKPTGIVLDEAFVNRFRNAVLDARDYVYQDLDDLPEPQVGFRFRDGELVFDILVSLEGSSSVSPHIDLFICENHEASVSKYLSDVCLPSKALHELLASVLPQYCPDLNIAD